MQSKMVNEIRQTKIERPVFRNCWIRTRTRWWCCCAAGTADLGLLEGWWKVGKVGLRLRFLLRVLGVEGRHDEGSGIALVTKMGDGERNVGNVARNEVYFEVLCTAT